MSLVWAGKFDISGNWDTQRRRHAEHRLGESVDIDVRDGTQDDDYARAVTFIWETILGHTVNDERASLNHAGMGHDQRDGRCRGGRFCGWVLPLRGRRHRHRKVLRARVRTGAVHGGYRDDPGRARQPVWLDSHQGWTIAVVPFPTDMTAHGLAVRIEELTDNACALGWVAEPGICNSLEAKQRAAHRAIEQGNFGTACNNMAALLNEVDALPPSKLLDEGRALVRLNALHFRRTHCS